MIEGVDLISSHQEYEHAFSLCEEILTALMV